MQKFNNYFTDFHTNIHSKQVADFDLWYKHARQVIDFWPFAYYPYHEVMLGSGLKTEGELDVETIKSDWNELVKKTNEYNRINPEFPLLCGYEWQGSGEDGDHNVFFKEDGPCILPKRYNELKNELSEFSSIAIPHHLAYSLEHRGKNWATHDSEFSPFAEIYSSHGSSEQSVCESEMSRHIHMGPRTGSTSVFNGLNLGNKVGIIASGDNHVVPADTNNGLAGVWAQSNSKDDLWEALKSRRVYGMTKNHMKLWMDIDENPMGSTITKSDKPRTVHVNVTGNSAIDRVELIRNGVVANVYTHSGNWETLNSNDSIRFKTHIDFGWGPNPSVYKNLTKRLWEGTLSTNGSIVSVEKCWSNLGQKVLYQDSHKFDFGMTTYKSSHSGKWMGQAPVVSEGFIIEFEGKLSDEVNLTINGNKTMKKFSDILEETDLIIELEESKKIAKETFGVSDYYRSDPFYHNAYKTRILKGIPNVGYEVSCEFSIDTVYQDGWYIVKVFQDDGQIAWSSPVWFINKE